MLPSSPFRSLVSFFFFPGLICFAHMCVLITEYWWRPSTDFRSSLSIYVSLLPLILCPAIPTSLTFPYSQLHFLISGRLWALRRFPLHCCNLWPFSRQLDRHSHRVHLIVSLLSRITLLHCLMANVLRVCQLFKFFSDRKVNLISFTPWLEAKVPIWQFSKIPFLIIYV